MDAIHSLLNEMRGRLGMYLGTTSVTKLASFLRGYEHALYKMGDRSSHGFLASFRDWIHDRYKTTKASWEDLILRQCAGDEAAAADLFWRLLDEYLAETNSEGLLQDSTNGRIGAAAKT